MYLCEVFVKWSNKMMKEIVFATHNAHKASEIRNILGDSVKVKTLTDINLFEEIPENGNTFEENSFIKADFSPVRRKGAAVGIKLVFYTVKGKFGAAYSVCYSSDNRALIAA